MRSSHHGIHSVSFYLNSEQSGFEFAQNSNMLGIEPGQFCCEALGSTIAMDSVSRDFDLVWIRYVILNIANLNE